MAYEAKSYFGQGLELNGVNQGIDNVLSGIAYPLTIMCRTNGGSGYIVSSNYGGSERLYLYVSSGTYNIRLGDSSSEDTGIAVSGKDNIRLEILDGSYKLTVNSKVHEGTFVTQNNGVTNGIKIGLDPDSAGSYSGIIKDVYIFNRVLTQIEIDKSFKQPEQFYNDVITGTISGCVLNMPLCENDEYVRDMVEYSETNVGTNFDDSLLTPLYPHYGDATASVVSGEVVVTVSSIYGNLRRDLLDSKTYYSTVKISDVDSMDWFLFDNTGKSVPIIGAGTYNLLTSGATIIMVQKRENDGILTTIKIDSFEVLELTGIHPILNYTTSCRDDAKQLDWGSQQSKFEVDTLGVRQNYVADFLMCDGRGYLDTGWVPSADEDWTIELACYRIPQQLDTMMGNSQNGVRYRIFTNGRDYFYIGGVTFVLYASSNVGELVTYTITYNSTTQIISIFVNGLFVTSSPVTLTSITNFHIANDSYYGTSTTFAYKSTIRLFKVHNKTMSDREVKYRYDKAVVAGLLD